MHTLVVAAAFLVISAVRRDLLVETPSNLEIAGASDSSCQAVETTPRLSSSRRVQGPYCGIACLYGAARALGKQFDFESLIEVKYIGSIRGSSIDELCAAAKDFGIHTVPLVGLTMEALHATKDPIILHTASEGQLQDYDHWALFLGFENGMARVLDPPDAMIQLLPIADLLARWDGAGIIVSDKTIEAKGVIAVECAQVSEYILLALGVVAAFWLAVEQHSARAALISSNKHLRLLAVAILLFVIGSVFGVAINMLPIQGLLRHRATVNYIALAQNVSSFSYCDIEEVRRLMRQSGTVVVDARFSSDFSRGHLPGAVNLPVNVTPGKRRRLVSAIPRSSRVIIYCQSSDCPFSEKIGALLAGDGFERVTIYRGGWLDWQNNMTSRAAKVR